MFVGKIMVKIDLPWVNSLKEKRKEVKSITAKLKNKFNLSVIEYDNQDIHKTASIGVAFAVANFSHIEEYNNKIIHFLDGTTQGEVYIVETHSY